MKGREAWFFLVYWLVFVGAGCKQAPLNLQNLPALNSAGAPANTAEIIRVVDGDTVVVKVNGINETIRLLGINTPESVDPRRPVECFGLAASKHVKELLSPGTAVLLEKDREADERDKYNRLLRSIYLMDQKTFVTSTYLNAALVADGYAHAYTSFPFSHNVEFSALQRTARAAKLGLWSPTTCNGKK